MSLSKDCTCPDHEGPHWLHEIWVAERTNLAVLQVAIDNGNDLVSAVGAFFWAEFRRKNEIAQHMRRRGLEEIPADLIPPPPPSLRYPCFPDGTPHPAMALLFELMLWDVNP